MREPSIHGLVALGFPLGTLKYRLEAIGDVAIMGDRREFDGSNNREQHVRLIIATQVVDRQHVRSRRMSEQSSDAVLAQVHAQRRVRKRVPERVKRVAAIRDLTAFA